MFSASEILSVLETLQILTLRQEFTPKAYITNLAGPSRVPAQLLTGNPLFRLAESHYLSKRCFYMLAKNDHLSYFPKTMPL